MGFDNLLLDFFELYRFKFILDLYSNYDIFQQLYYVGHVSETNRGEIATTYTS